MLGSGGCSCRALILIYFLFLLFRLFGPVLSLGFRSQIRLSVSWDLRLSRMVQKPDKVDGYCPSLRRQQVSLWRFFVNELAPQKYSVGAIFPELYSGLRKSLYLCPNKMGFLLLL